MVGGDGAVATSDATLDGEEIYDPSTGRCSTAERMCKARFHPTQKPVEIMRWCIDMLPAKGGGWGDTIIDPYRGQRQHRHRSDSVGGEVHRRGDQ